MSIREIIIKWLQKASEMEPNERMLFPADTRRDQKEKCKLFLQELKILAKIDPIGASQLQVTTKFEDHRLWVVVKKIAFSPLIAFKKDKDGIVERVIIDDDSDKMRRLALMKSDGYSLDEIIEVEGELSGEEKDFIKEGG